VSSAGEPRTLAGRYRLDEVIGRGGMSTVYRGIDLELDRVVAVKVALDPLVEQSPIYLARFTREAHAAAAIGHPGVVTVYDAGADGPTRFIVMEFVPGRSLADILRDEHPLEPYRAANIAAQVADALSAAHAAGIVHRDVKPGNIMVTPDGSVKVLDFGIARALDSHTLTQTATVLGTSAYMSPEQAMGQPVDARSDIYSLGCVLYEMLTGEPPFIADVSAAVLHQHVRVEPKPARERNAAIPPALNDLVMQMLAKSPGDRPQTAAEVRDRLRQALADHQDGSDDRTTIAMAAAMAPTPATVPIQATEPAPDQAREPTEAAEATEATAATAALAPRPPDRTPPPNRPRTAAPSPPPRERRSATGFWITVFILAAVLLGGAAAIALSGGGSTGTTSSGHSTPSNTGSHTTPHTNTSPPPLTHTSTSSTTPPPQSTSSSNPSSTSKSTTSTSATSPPTTTTTPPASTSASTTGTGASTTGTGASTTGTGASTTGTTSP
jgi:eukaryotic-like serine/threonine-protein kinase